MVKIFITGLLCFICTGVLWAETFEFSSGVERNRLLELYTSEGCSSCPPAEVRLNAFEKSPELWKTLFPVAFHVDYWDYLGWKDPFAQSVYSKRQRQYARAGHVSSVYTPSFMLNGRSAGPRLARLPEAVGSPGVLSVVVSGRNLHANFQPVPSRTSRNIDRYELNATILGMGLTSKITRGENRGRTSTHHFVVFDHARQVSDSNEWQLLLPQIQDFSAEKFAVVVWVTPKGSFTPLQTTGGYIN